MHESAAGHSSGIEGAGWPQSALYSLSEDEVPVIERRKGQGGTHEQIRRTPPPGVTPPRVNVADLLEALPDAIVMVDAEGAIVYGNSLLEQLSGYNAAALLGKPIEALVPDRFRASHVSERSHYTSDPRPRPMGAKLQISMRRKDGSEFPADISLSPLQTEAGLNIVAAVRDASERQRLALLDERERIAKELHDGVIQGLYAVGMTLQAIQARADAEAVRTRLDGAIESIDAAIRDLRSYIFGLRPGILADRQLDQALRELGREFEVRSGVVTVVEVDASMAAHFASSATQVIQMAREGLSNVGRHAQATTCRLSLVQRGKDAVLEIDDDGRGFDPSQVSKGMGLTNIKGRARTMGGEVVVNSSPGQGSTLQINLPL